MNDRALRYFLTVVRAGSVRAAAETLNVAASAVSRRIIEMEAEIGQPLLERLPRGVVPTEAGRVVAEHARRQADERLILEDRLKRLRGVEEGTVRIGRRTVLVSIMANAGTFIGAALIAQFWMHPPV